MAKIFIETERLVLREIIPEDAEAFFAMDSNPEVVKYVGIKPLTNISQSIENIASIRNQYIENGIGRWAVIEKTSELLIGWSGLKLYTAEINGYQNFYELGYRFCPESWGKGYAFESAKASLNFGFNNLNVKIIYAYAHEENAASHKVLNKLGFEKTSEFNEPDGICFWYELKRENFKL